MPHTHSLSSPKSGTTGYPLIAIVISLPFQVSLTYYQTGTSAEHLRSSLRPFSSVAYALDEPSLAPHLTLCVQGGGSSVATYNLDVLAEGEPLRYERFYYICMGSNGNLVFDVQPDGQHAHGETKRVFLQHRVSAHL